MRHVLMGSVFLACSLLGVPESGFAQSGQNSAASPAGTAFNPAGVVDEVRRKISEHYVLPAKRSQIDKALADGLASGRYAVASPQMFVERVNADLARASNDRHLYMRYDPQRVAALTQGPPPEPGKLPPELVLAAKAHNHGLTDMRIMAGNVRYLEVTSFDWIGEESEVAYDQAIGFLKNADAIIIDLRRNGGGSGRAVHQLISQFVPADTPLIKFMQGSEESPVMRSLPNQTKLAGKPLYVLTSRSTGSAAEEFAAHVAGYKIGDTVGTPTSGAAYHNDIFPIDGKFELSLSVARPVLSSTGSDWEAVGVQPSLPTTSDQSLALAHATALRRLAAKSSDNRLALEETAQAVMAISQGRQSSAGLKSYAGQYGKGSISFENGRLWYRGEDGLRFAMVPLGGDSFTLDGAADVRITFRREGRSIGAIEYQTSGRSGSRLYERSKA